MITYAFPPVAYVGVHRTLKYCRYLLGYGWEARVITARPSRMAHLDDALCAQVPKQVKVTRTWDLDPAKWLELLTKHRHRVRGTSKRAIVTPAGNSPPSSRGFYKSLKESVLRLLTASPDSHVFWVPAAFFAGFSALVSRRVDVIFSTSPPHSSHLAAVLLSKVFRIPYVVDFRDPWNVYCASGTVLSRRTVLTRVEHWMWKITVEQAAHVFTVSNGECAELIRDFPQCDSSKFTFISNGFDASDFPATRGVGRTPGLVVLTHAGTVYPGAAGQFFVALAQLALEEPDIAAHLRVRFVGAIADEYGTAVAELAATGLVDNGGLVSHSTALNMMLESDALLVLLGGAFGEAEIPAKVFEYLHAGKPILTLAGEGELARIVRQSGLGVVIAPSSSEEIKKALRELTFDSSSAMWCREANRDYVRQFDRQALAGTLADVLNKVVEAER